MIEERAEEIAYIIECCMAGQGIGHWSVGDEKQLKGFKKGHNGIGKVILQVVLRMALVVGTERKKMLSPLWTCYI